MSRLAYARTPALALALWGCRPSGAPAPLSPPPEPTPALRTMADTEAWFASSFAPLLGATVVRRSDARDERPAYGQHISDVYEDARLDACVLHYTIVRSSVEFPANPLSPSRPSRARVSIPLRDLDLSRTTLRQVRDTSLIREPFVVELRTTAAAGRTMTTIRERRTYRHGATQLHVATPEAGVAVQHAVAAAARLCGPPSPAP